MAIVQELTFSSLSTNAYNNIAMLMIYNISYLFDAVGTLSKIVRKEDLVFLHPLIAIWVKFKGKNRF